MASHLGCRICIQKYKVRRAFNSPVAAAILRDTKIHSSKVEAAGLTRVLVVGPRVESKPPHYHAARERDRARPEGLLLLLCCPPSPNKERESVLRILEVMSREPFLYYNSDLLYSRYTFGDCSIMYTCHARAQPAGYRTRLLSKTS